MLLLPKGEFTCRGILCDTGQSSLKGLERGRPFVRAASACESSWAEKVEKAEKKVEKAEKKVEKAKKEVQGLSSSCCHSMPQFFRPS